MSKFRPKQATKLLCTTAQSKRHGADSWQVFDYHTDEILGSGQSAKSALAMAYAQLCMRIQPPAECKRCAEYDEVHDARCPDHPDYDYCEYCTPCGARTADKCTCPPIADNE